MDNNQKQYINVNLFETNEFEFTEENGNSFKIYGLLGSGGYGRTFFCKNISGNPKYHENKKYIAKFCVMQAQEAIQNSPTTIREIQSLRTINSYSQYPFFTDCIEYIKPTIPFYFTERDSRGHRIKYIVESMYTSEFIPKNPKKILINFAAQILYEFLSHTEFANSECTKNNIDGLIKLFRSKQQIVQTRHYKNNTILKVYNDRYNSCAYMRYILWIQETLRGFLIMLDKMSKDKICYRDMKDDNYLFNDYYEPILIDFGLARSDSLAGDQFIAHATRSALRDPLCIVGFEAGHVESDWWSFMIEIYAYLSIPIEKICKDILNIFTRVNERVSKNFAVEILNKLKIYRETDALVPKIFRIFDYCKIKDVLTMFMDIGYMESITNFIIESQLKNIPIPNLWKDYQITQETIEKLKREKHDFIKMFSVKSTMNIDLIKETFPESGYSGMNFSEPMAIHSPSAWNVCINGRANTKDNLEEILLNIIIDFGLTEEDKVELQAKFTPKNATIEYDNFQQKYIIQCCNNEYKKETMKNNMTSLFITNSSNVNIQNANSTQNYVNTFIDVLAEVLVISRTKRSQPDTILYKYKDWFNNIPYFDSANKFITYISEEIEEKQSTSCLKIIKNKYKWLPDYLISEITSRYNKETENQNNEAENENNDNNEINLMNPMNFMDPDDPMNFFNSIDQSNLINPLNQIDPFNNNLNQLN